MNVRSKLSLLMLILSMLGVVCCASAAPPAPPTPTPIDAETLTENAIRALPLGTLLTNTKTFTWKYYKPLGCVYYFTGVNAAMGALVDKELSPPAEWPDGLAVVFGQEKTSTTTTVVVEGSEYDGPQTKTETKVVFETVVIKASNGQLFFAHYDPDEG